MSHGTNTRICFICRGEIVPNFGGAPNFSSGHIDGFKVHVGKGYAHNRCASRKQAARTARMNYTNTGNVPTPLADDSFCVPGATTNAIAAIAMEKRVKEEEKLKKLHEFPCPACKSTKTTAADDWEYSVLRDEALKRDGPVPILPGRDGVPFSVCLDCGVAFLPKQYLGGIKKDIARTSDTLRKQMGGIPVETPRLSRWSDKVARLFLIGIFMVVGSGLGYVGYGIAKDVWNGGTVQDAAIDQYDQIDNLVTDEMRKLLEER